MITETDLIKIRVIKTKHLRQINLVPYDPEVYNRIHDDLNSGKLMVHYWIKGSEIGLSTIDRLWLVTTSNSVLTLIIAPTTEDHEGKIIPEWEKFRDVRQLFAD